ncbi:hypothetical protein D1AOALGA4SA_5415 [Olavius algarvensis Delta 1 endosymbiont]|nr:hypothetical protein D1AOALGA4SA_5415 [Olavius algarvensis Delta 1 endosymbiont]
MRRELIFSYNYRIVKKIPENLFPTKVATNYIIMSNCLLLNGNFL